jgi:hypothetical protein
MSSRCPALRAALAALVLLAGPAVLHAASALPPSVLRAFAKPERQQDCFDLPHAHERPQWSCVIGARQVDPSFVLFGDSHALQVASAFDRAAVDVGRSGVFMGFSGCPPLQQVVPVTRPDQDRADCQALNARVLQFVRARRIRDVYLVARWSYYTDPIPGGTYINALGLRRGEPASLERSRGVFSAAYDATVDAYAQAGARVHVLEQVPHLAVDVRATYARAWADPRTGRQVLARAALPLAHHRALQAYPASVFHRPRRGASVDLLNADGLFCAVGSCTVGTLERPFYSDDNHLSVYGAELLVPQLERSLRQGNPGH